MSKVFRREFTDGSEDFIHEDGSPATRTEWQESRGATGERVTEVDRRITELRGEYGDFRLWRDCGLGLRESLIACGLEPTPENLKLAEEVDHGV